MKKKTESDLIIRKKIINFNDAAAWLFPSHLMGNHWLHHLHQRLLFVKCILGYIGFGLSLVEFVILFLCAVCTISNGGHNSDDDFWLAAD
nr:hypothetical protein [Lentilactobacillus otakiensis]